MVLKSDAMKQAEEPKEEEKTHEVRLDHEGKGYLYRLDKGKKEEKPVEEVEEVEEKPKKKKRGKK